MSLGASERMSAAERASKAKRAVRSKRMRERCELTSERTSEWPSTYFSITGLSTPPCSEASFPPLNEFKYIQL